MKYQAFLDADCTVIQLADGRTVRHNPSGLHVSGTAPLPTLLGMLIREVMKREVPGSDRAREFFADANANKLGEHLLKAAD